MIVSDGTHRGANQIGEECIARKLNISVAGIPKTIDNVSHLFHWTMATRFINMLKDVDLIDRSFGFQTSVEAAQAAIVSAKTEARCNLPNGIGIVKLMGRSAGPLCVYYHLTHCILSLVG